ncbi:hypothetical protein MASR2M41_08150 [Flammeovirgaceae bacterium]
MEKNSKAPSMSLLTEKEKVLATAKFIGMMDESTCLSFSKSIQDTLGLRALSEVIAHQKEGLITEWNKYVLEDKLSIDELKAHVGHVHFGKMYRAKFSKEVPERYLR